MDVTRIGQLPGTVPAPAEVPAEGAKPAGSASFADVLENSLAQVNALQREADAAIQALASGGTGTLHDTMLAIQQADLSFRLMMQVRNKIVEAYQEILRMQV
jgi:flagellar hook-basal body complex protein FliE